MAITVDLDTTQVNAPRWVGTPVLVVEGQNGHVQHHHEITSIRALGNPSLLDALLDLVFALHQNTIGCTPAYDVWRIVSDREARMTIKVSFTRYGVGMSQDWDSYEVKTTRPPSVPSTRPSLPTQASWPTTPK